MTVKPWWRKTYSESERRQQKVDTENLERATKGSFLLDPLKEDREFKDSNKMMLGVTDKQSKTTKQCIKVDGSTGWIWKEKWKA